MLEAAAGSHQAALNGRSQAKAILEEERLEWKTALIRFHFAARLALPDRRSYVESLFAVSGRPQPAEEPGPASAAAT